MDHVAIMTKKWKLIDKILSGEKTIESRWYVNRVKPWQAISPGDRIYFKDTGCPVTASAEVAEVLYFENLNEQLFNQLLTKYGNDICLVNRNYLDYYRNKRYVILIKLRNPHRLEQPFEIDKTGYGNAAAWLTGEIKPK